MTDNATTFTEAFFTLHPMRSTAGNLAAALAATREELDVRARHGH